MPVTIIHQDITRLNVDAIIIVSNKEFMKDNSAIQSIFNEMQQQQIDDHLVADKTGEPLITPGYGVSANFIMHVIAPEISNTMDGLDEESLYLWFTNSLESARINNFNSIAIPFLSNGMTGYAADIVENVAQKAIREFLLKNDLDVYFVAMDDEVFRGNKALYNEVAHYLNINLVDEPFLFPMEKPLICHESVMVPDKNLDDLMNDLSSSFSVHLMNLIDAKGKTDVEVYKRANLDRRLFSKIRKTEDYTPSKRTVIALAIALELTLEETDVFLEIAGYALSPSNKFDVIIEYFIEHQIYDIFEINQILFQYEQPLLGG